MILINEQRLLQIYQRCWQFSQLVLIVLIGQMFQLFSLDTKIIKYAPYLRLVSLAFGVTKIAQLSSKVTLTENARWGTVLNGRIYGYLVMVAFFTAIKKSTSHVDSTHKLTHTRVHFSRILILHLHHFWPLKKWWKCKCSKSGWQRQSGMNPNVLHNPIKGLKRGFFLPLKGRMYGIQNIKKSLLTLFGTLIEP